MRTLKRPVLFVLLALFFLSGCVTDSAGNKPLTAVLKPSQDRAIQVAAHLRDEVMDRRMGRWAVVVGISDYRYDQRWDRQKGIPDLRYADRDAEAFADFLLSPAGGAFPPDKVLLLTNRQATVQNVRMAIGDFLAKSLEDDLVIIFFAGHGAADPNKPDNLYLLCHDTQPGKFYGTALPMWEINTAIDRSIGSNRIIVLADACHSAGVAGTRGLSSANQFNTYMAQLARSKTGVSKITASRANELSQERTFPEGGHGLFTYYLLDGLKGKADYDRNGFVTLKEAYEHLYDKVRSESRRSQNPWASAYVSEDIPLGIVDRQVLAAVKARAKAQESRPGPVSGPAIPAPAAVDVPKDSAIAVKLAQAKLAKDEIMVARDIVETVLKRADNAKPDALALKIDLLLKDRDLKGAEDTEDLLVIPYAEHPAAKKGAAAIYEYYLSQVADATPKERIAQIEAYLRRHSNGLLESRVKADLEQVGAGIKGRYEKSFSEQLILAKGFMGQHRFEKSQEALSQAERIADEALSDFGIRLTRQSIDHLRVQLETERMAYQQQTAFDAAKAKAQREQIEDPILTWQAFVDNNPGNPHTTEAEKTLQTLRSRASAQMQARFDRYLQTAKSALQAKGFARCLQNLDNADALSMKASDRLGIMLNTRDLSSVRTSQRTEAQKHQNYIAWHNSDEAAKAVSLNDTSDYDRRIGIYEDFMSKWPDSSYQSNARQAVSDLKSEKTAFMDRRFNTYFSRARARFIAEDFTAAYAALEKAGTYADARQKQQIDDLARRYNAPPEVSIELSEDTVDWESPVTFSYNTSDKEGDPVRVVAWEFGDGARSSDDRPLREYAKWSGTDTLRQYTVMLKATDGHSTVTTKKTITVKKQACVAKDGRYCKFRTGVVRDTSNDLEWYAGSDRDTTWDYAKRWVENLTVDGGGWRMPSRSELRGLYQKGVGSRNMTPLLETTGSWVWSWETDGASALYFYFGLGYEIWGTRSRAHGVRAFAVRSRR